MNISADDVMAIAAVLAILGTVIAAMYKMGAELGHLRTKVDIMWSFMCKRMVIEGFQHEWVEEHSPMQLTEKAIQAMAPLTPILREWYSAEGHRLTDLDLMLQIELRFGEKLVEEVCRPNLISNGICLIAAAMVCGRGMAGITDKSTETR